MLAEVFGRCGKVAVREPFGVFVGIVVLLFFFGVGIDMIIHPRRHMNSYSRSGGEMLREWNETCTQVAGLIFSCVSGWMLYELVRSVWAECFG
jgi:hypothetical protein